jgi:hypothetical protein
MAPGDRALIQIGIDPTGPDWYQGAQEALKRFQSGQMPHRVEISLERVIKGLAKAGAAVGMELINTITEIITEKEIVPEPILDPERDQFTRQALSNNTLTKTRGPAFDVTIRIAAGSKNPERRRTIIRGLGTAFRTLTDDNELIFQEAKTGHFGDDMIRRVVSPVKVNYDLLSAGELAKFLQLPPWSLQQEFPIENIITRELEVPAVMARGGILIGEVTRKGIKTPVYWPVDSYDELCLPRVAVGGQGTGKSLGFGAGFAADAIRKGFSVFAIDVTDGEMANAIRDSMPAKFPVDHLIDLNFGDPAWPIPLNWAEVSRPSARTREISNVLTNQLTNYLAKFSDEAGDRTERYMKAAGRAVFTQDPEATILDVLLFLCSPAFRGQFLPRITDPRLMDLWRDFEGMSEGLKSAITAPILNRFDSLLGNEYISNCVCQKPKTGAGRIDSLRRCVSEQKARDPSASGVLKMKWVISADGNVRDVKALPGEYASGPFSGCISGVVRGIKFPRSATSGQEVTFPFSF